jgi:pantoate--beta-alanine ligase
MGLTTLTTIREMQAWSASILKEGKTIGFVPTMGYLHEGHASLIRKAKSVCDVVVVSVFVNPTQFAPNEDFTKYPRSIERDTELALTNGVDCVFMPSASEMYPNGTDSVRTTISVNTITEKFEGAFRPTHFAGVALVVTKLFLAVQPTDTFFGRKDYQQTLVIKSLIEDLNFPIRLHVEPTMREKDGLAMSSRNVYLQPQERSSSVIVFRALSSCNNAIANGIRSSAILDSTIQESLNTVENLTIDYAECVLADTLERKAEFVSGDKIVALIAVRLGTVRLIDNEVFVIP